MNFNLIKIPFIRSGLYTDLNYNIYNEWINKIIPFDNILIKSEKESRIDLTNNGIGYFVNPTLREFVSKFILGTVINTGSSVNINVENPFQSEINGHPLNIALKYRLECLLNYTPSEYKLLNILFSRKFHRKSKIKCINKHNFRNQNKRLVTTQAITYLDNRFYIADYVIQLQGYRPLIVELDGKYHESIAQIEYDIERSLNIKEIYGIDVLRFKNEEIINEDYIIDSILDNLNQIGPIKFKSEIPSNLIEKHYFNSKIEFINFILSLRDRLDIQFIKINHFNKIIVECYNREFKLINYSRLKFKTLFNNYKLINKFLNRQQILSILNLLK